MHLKITNVINSHKLIFRKQYIRNYFEVTSWGALFILFFFILFEFSNQVFKKHKVRNPGFFASGFGGLLRKNFHYSSGLQNFFLVLLQFYFFHLSVWSIWNLFGYKVWGRTVFSPTNSSCHNATYWIINQFFQLLEISPLS